MRQCKMTHCEYQLFCKGLCSRHYHRLQRYGDPLYKDPVLICNFYQCTNLLDNSMKFCSIHFEMSQDDVKLSYRLWSTYKLSWERYSHFLQVQNNKCAICKTSDIGRNSRFDIDHDHYCCPGRKSCGECVRGLLCSSCNSILAVFGDDFERIRSAIEYLSVA